MQNNVIPDGNAMFFRALQLSTRARETVCEKRPGGEDMSRHPLPPRRRQRARLQNRTLFATEP